MVDFRGLLSIFLPGRWKGLCEFLTLDNNLISDRRLSL
jgi:hypothetical protein